MNQKLFQALNTQVNKEFYSAYLYMAMAAFFESQKLKGCANWMVAQAQEEVTHAMKIYHYIFQQNQRVHLPAIDKPPSQWASPLAVFEAALAHEKKVTGMIHHLVDIAGEVGDGETKSFLKWFVDEQAEEEESAGKVVEKLKVVSHNTEKLKALDKELSQRKLLSEALA